MCLGLQCPARAHHSLNGKVLYLRGIYIVGGSTRGLCIGLTIRWPSSGLEIAWVYQMSPDVVGG